MLWDRILRFIQGWVVFEGEGDAPERLLSAAGAEGVMLWNTRCRPFYVRSCCRASDYRRLRLLVRHSGLRLRLRSKRGLPFAVRGYRRRYGLVVGAVLAVALLAVLPRYVWVVTVEGNRTLPAQRILEAVEPLGVVPGARWEELDIPAIRLKALTLLPEAAWLTVNPEGSIARVVITERDGVADPDRDSTPSNLVAACDGVIRRVIAAGGYPAVEAGEAVTAGDLLVSGVYEVEGFRDLTRSAGQVWAVTEHTVSVEIPLKERCRLPAGDSCFRPAFQFLNWWVPLYTAAPLTGDWAVTEEDRRLTLRGITLPLGVVSRTYTAYVPVTVTRTEPEAAALAEAELVRLFQERYPKAAVLSRRDTAGVADGVYRLEAVLTCEEDIAREVPLVIVP